VLLFNVVGPVVQMVPLPLLNLAIAVLAVRTPTLALLFSVIGQAVQMGPLLLPSLEIAVPAALNQKVQPRSVHTLLAAGLHVPMEQSQ